MTEYILILKLISCIFKSQYKKKKIFVNSCFASICYAKTLYFAVKHFSLLGIEIMKK